MQTAALKDDSAITVIRLNTFITGGLGFIGSHVIEGLIEQGNVTAFDDLSSGKIENVGHCIGSSKLKVTTGDIRNAGHLFAALRDSKSEVVIHLAGAVSVIRSVEDPELVNQINVDGTVNTLRACVRAGVRKVIFASTAAVYEKSSLPLNEDSRLAPLSPYAASKAAGEAYCRAFAHSYHLETVVMRLFNVYGPRRAEGPYSGVMVRFAQAIKDGAPFTIYGDGFQVRDFVHIQDVVKAVRLAMQRQFAEYEVLNIGSGVGTSVNELAGIFSTASGTSRPKSEHVPGRTSEVRDSRADISRAKSVLGFSPTVNLSNGVSEYLDWFLSKSKG